MNGRALIVGVVVCLALCIALALLTETAAAKAAAGSDLSVSGDKKLATKTGVTLGSKEFDKQKLPGPLKIGFAIGSVVTAIAVMKWL